MSNVLSEIRSGLEKRLRELEPALEEHAQLVKALDALKGAGSHAEQALSRAVTRSRPVKAAATGKPRRSAAAAGGRAQEALKLVHAHPGITIAEMAARMKIKANYLYRVLPHLERDAKIKKHGKGYHPAGESTAVPSPTRVRRDQETGYPRKRPARRS